MHLVLFNISINLPCVLAPRAGWSCW